MAASLVVLDVGHGNSILFQDDHRSVIIDACIGPVALLQLRELGIHRVEAILISHGDQDHIGGVVELLSQKWLEIDKVYANSETLRRTGMWRSFRRALRDARHRGTVVHAELTTSMSPEFDWGASKLEILAPTPELALSGAGGRDLGERSLTANSMSVVVRVIYGQHALALLTGDLDEIGLDHLLVEYPQPNATMLVFPHHGGYPGRTNGYAFARRLTAAVQPELVVFSIGRGQHGTPQPDIVRGIRSTNQSVRIACTELSERCASVLPSIQPQHLGNYIAKGSRAGLCCAGSVAMLISADSIVWTPSVQRHQTFITMHVPSALCREPIDE